MALYTRRPTNAVPVVLLRDQSNQAPVVIRDPVIDSLVGLTAREFKLPAAAAALITRDTIRLGKYGVRKFGDSTPIALADRFHIGSNTKSFTATLAGIAVERGLITWTTRPVEVFPELADSISPAFNAITFRDFLQMRAGIEAFTDGSEFTNLPAGILTGSPVDQRRKLTAYLLHAGPFGEIGHYAYSNVSYSIAAAMLERVFRRPWEQLVIDSVAKPLGLDVTIGWPAKHDPNQPWGHWIISGGRAGAPGAPIFNGEIRPHDPNSGYDILDVINPGGGLAMSIRDFALFVQFNLRGLTGTDSLLRARTLRTLHEVRGQYAMGWDDGRLNIRTGTCVDRVYGSAVDRREHAGSGGTFLTRAIIVPEKGVAVAMMTNIAIPALDSLCARLFRLRP